MKKRIASIALAGTMATTPVASASGLGPEMHEEVMLKEYYEYLMNIKNEDMSLYDSEFIEYFRNGKIVIKGKLYDINTLFLLECQKNDVRKVMVLCSDNIRYDIISGDSYKGYKKLAMKRFRDTEVFFNLFHIFRNNINDNVLVIEDNYYQEFINIIDQFNNTLHNEAPETKYGRGRY